MLWRKFITNARALKSSKTFNIETMLQKHSYAEMALYRGWKTDYFFRKKCGLWKMWIVPIIIGGLEIVPQQMEIQDTIETVQINRES